MDFSDEQMMLREAARGQLGRDAPIGRVREAAEARDFSRFRRLERSQGWPGVGVSDQDGGEGGGPIELAIIAEEIGRAVLPGDFVAFNGLLVPALLGVGADGMLTSVLADERRSVLALSADGCFAAGGIAADGRGRLGGEVASVLGAADADVLVVPAAGSLYEVDAGAAGVRIEPRPLADRTRQIADVSLAEVEAKPVEARRDFDPADLIPLAGILVAADALGVASRMLEMTVEYVKDREQFGRPVGGFQAVKHTAADMLVAIEMSRSATYHAAWSLAASLEAAPVHAAAAKALSTESAAAVADSAVALHGAVGYTWEHDLHVYFKRAKLDLALLGPPAQHRERIAAALELSAEPILESTTTSPRGG